MVYTFVMTANRNYQGAPLAQLLLLAVRWFRESLLATLVEAGWPESSPAQAMVFAHLDVDSGTRISELARRIGVSRQAVHRTTNELLALGLVAKVPDPSNRSAKLVTLTAEGREVVAAALASFAEIEAILADRIGAETLAALRRAVELDWGEPLTGSTRSPT